MKKLLDNSLIVPGWDNNISTEDYRAERVAVNSSALKNILKSPLAFYESFTGQGKEPTKRMKWGQIIHLATLEGSEFKRRYVVMPEFESRTANGEISDSKNTKYYKNQVADWKKTLAHDAVILTEEEREKVFKTIQSVLNHKTASNLLKKGMPEQVGYWVDKKTGINCRMQADFISLDANILLDIKTTTNCEWDYFRRSVEGFKYPFQLAMYASGIEHITGKFPQYLLWLVIDSEAPFEVRVYELSPQYIEIGMYEYRLALTKLKECIETNNFKGGQKEVEIVEPSPWYFNKYNDLGLIGE